ncbi:hypothetical protein TNCV_2262351 [Trichonephila clavipes]|nr:hypothetical protein TNCV_2262351 [Trichonephila clavipes]
MHFPAFSFSLLIVLVTGFSFAEAASQKSIRKIRRLMCDEDLRETRMAGLECVYLVDWSEYDGIVRPCSEAFKSRDIEEVRQSMCQSSDEELLKITCGDPDVAAVGGFKEEADMILE